MSLRRNGDEGLRAAERAARAGDPQAQLRYAMALRRSGQLDQIVESAASNLDERRANDLLAAWSIAGGEGRIRLYRALASAGIRYPDAAFLSALSGDERLLCLVSALMHSGERWGTRMEAFGLQGHPHSIEVVYPDRRDVYGRAERLSNQDQYMGREGLKRARAEAVPIEAEWAELVRATINHKSGGFVEHTTFLTPDGYAQRSVYFHEESEHWQCGVAHWDYDIRRGFLPETPDDLSARHSLPFIAAVHDLELKVQGLLSGLGGRYSEAPSEHVPGHLVQETGRAWMNTTPKALVAESRGCGGYSGPVAWCLVVIPPSTGEPPVTIGITSRHGGRVTERMWRVNPAHFWTELAPWSDPINRRLEKRLADWAATDAPDRIRVEQGNVALVWQDWSHRARQRLNEMRNARRAEEREQRGY